MSLSFFDHFERADEASLPDRLARDVSDLLSARSIVPGVKRHGVLAYGLPGLEGLRRRSPEARSRMAHYIEATLRAFEPRLDAVRVAPAGDDFEFTVQAELREAHSVRAVTLRILSPLFGAGFGAEAQVVDLDPAFAGAAA